MRVLSSLRSQTCCINLWCFDASYDGLYIFVLSPNPHPFWWRKETVCIQSKQSTSCMGTWDLCPQTNEQHKKESTLLTDQRLPLGTRSNHSYQIWVTHMVVWSGIQAISILVPGAPCTHAAIDATIHAAIHANVVIWWPWGAFSDFARREWGESHQWVLDWSRK